MSTIQTDADSGVSRGASKDAPDSRRWVALVVIAVAQLMVVLDASIVNIALPSAQRSLHITDANRQWVVTAYALAFGGLLLLGGTTVVLGCGALMLRCLARAAAEGFVLACIGVAICAGIDGPLARLAVGAPVFGLVRPSRVRGGKAMPACTPARSWARLTLRTTPPWLTGRTSSSLAARAGASSVISGMALRRSAKRRTAGRSGR